MAEKTGCVDGSVKQDDTESPIKSSGSGKQNGKRRKILICGLIAVLLICVGIGGFFLFGPDGVFSSHAFVTVTFNSMGGSAIESQTVSKGGGLTEVGTPSRDGYLFAGWYYEEAPVNAYSAGDVFTRDTTLYAGWYQSDMEADKAEYISDCGSDIAFVVRSEAALTQDNLDDYIEFAVAGIDDGKTLTVKQQDDGYLLYSEDGFTPGNTYSISILDAKTISFVKAGGENVSGSGITSYSFTVHKENISNIAQKAETKLLSSANISTLEAVGQVADGETGNKNDNGKTIYRAALIKSDEEYRVGDIVSLGGGQKDSQENQYYKVIKTAKNSLDLIEPDMNEIYSEFELYYRGDAVGYVEDNENTGELEQSLQASLKESKGYDFLCTSIATGIKQSPTLLSTVSKLSVGDQNRFENLSVSSLAALLKNVKFNISFGKTQDIANKDNGCYGKISFTTGNIDIDLTDDIKLTINLTISEDITATAFGWLKLDGSEIYTDSGVYLNNKFDMSFSAVVATDSGTVNITEEIQKLVESNGDDKTQQIADSFNKENLFGEDIDYIEILSKQLGEKTITIYEVMSIQFTLDFKVSLGMRAGLDLNFSSSELRKIGMNNVDYSAGSLKASKTEMNHYSQRLKTELHFTVILKGKVGIRAGFEAGVNFSVVHMNKVLNFGFSAEIGVYEEISGYMRFDYYYTDSSGKSNSGMSLAGGIMSETGIYIELSFTWNLFGWEDSITIAEFKFPILTIGALEFASEFMETESAVAFNTNSYSIKNTDQNLLKLKYIDISGGANGVTINVKPAALNSDYEFFLVQDKTGKGTKDDLKYVTLDKSTGMVTVAGGAPDRLDFTVVVQYTKGCSLFSDKSEPITKNINFTYMKYKVANSEQKYKATFYKPDGSILEQKEYYVGQIPVPPAEDTYDDLFALTKYTLKSWSKPWKEDFTPLYNNADFHFDYEMNYKNITFRGYVYNKATGQYQVGIIAVVPTLVGEMPIAPSPGDIVAPLPWKFYRWDHSLNKATCDDVYTAEYIQSSDICWTAFYVDNQLIANDFPKKGTVPNAPDMSKYNTADRQFVGWTPSLRASTENYASYTAVFKSYVNVTFRDRNGKVLAQQRVLSGTTPVAPKADETVEGEEDYYEYRFRYWADEKGVKIGPVYWDTVYSPVYDKSYLEVTTTFDADGHAFADGTNIKVFKGTYKAYNFLYLPQVTYRDNEYTYTVDYWQSTQKVNGSYVKLYMSGFYTNYKYNLTFKPVFKKLARVVYTVCFFGGDQAICFKGYYGDLITSDMLDGLRITPTSEYYVYVLRDYGLTLPYRFGTVLGTDGLPAENISVVATFESVGVDKTFTFDANGGKYSDDTTVKTLTGPYGSKASFNEAPAKADDNWYTYKFVGWSSDKDAATGGSFSDFVINGNTTLYAVYEKTLKNPYTVTFDAGEGCFDGGKKTIQQAYIYGDIIVPPDGPVREETAEYRYVFIGWEPAFSAGTTVTGNCTYTAKYRVIRLDGTLEPTGIIVSDGVNYEDICVNSIPGYTYALAGEKAVPTLTVTGNGLTFSGISNEVCVVIESGVTDITFEDLTLSGAYTNVSGVLVTNETTSGLTINITGACTIRNTANGEQAVRFERPIQLTGTGEGAKLSISAKGCYATVYCGNSINVDSLELEISAEKRENDEEYNVTTLSSDGSCGDWHIIDSTIRLNSHGTVCFIEARIVLEDSTLIANGENGVFVDTLVLLRGSVVDVTANGENAIGLMTNELRFEDFYGNFSVRCTNLSSPGIAVMSYNGIKFILDTNEVGEDEYDLGGAKIGSFVDIETGVSYSSFGMDIEGTLWPVIAVTVKP